MNPVYERMRDCVDQIGFEDNHSIVSGERIYVLCCRGAKGDSQEIILVTNKHSTLLWECCEQFPCEK